MTTLLGDDIGLRLTWPDWRPPPLPPTNIDSWVGPWQERVDHLPVDRARTARLADYDVPFRCSGGRRPWEGSSNGMPWNIVDVSTGETKVWVSSKPIKWGGFLNLIPTFPTERMRLPKVVRRQGDPLGSSDKGVIVLVPGVELVEAILFQRNPLTAILGYPFSIGYDGGGAGLYRYDLRRPWTPSMKGTSAANVPKLPLLFKPEDLTNGINHTLFGAFTNYSPEKPVGWASGTDGTWPGHPVRAGDILRLKPDKVREFDPASPQHILAKGLSEYGLVCADKSTYGDPTDNGMFAVSTAMDERMLIPDMGLRLTDFEVIAAR